MGQLFNYRKWGTARKVEISTLQNDLGQEVSQRQKSLLSSVVAASSPWAIDEVGYPTVPDLGLAVMPKIGIMEGHSETKKIR